MSDDLDLIIEAFLTETTLTKGSQRVLNNASMVPDLADAVRDDARAHPHNFPPGSAKAFQKASDEDVAKWFLEQLDKIEREGYEGTIYSRDGVYNEWIVRRYISGSHNWEDLIGVMNMNLRDWTLLKNRGMLQTGHTDVPKFNSVRDIGKYMSTHYHDKLKDIRDAAALAAVKKQSKTAKIVDNDDYKIYTVFNWAGARTVGQGTQWCTANSKSDVNYNNYSNKAMLFQLFPKNPEEVDKTGSVIGVRTKGSEKYQFDAGSNSFRDIADDSATPSDIAKKFPYLLSDLIDGLKQNKVQLQTAIDAMADDETLKSPEAKTKKYDIDAEIEKLKKFKNSGYFTDKVRPKEKPEEPGNPEQPQIATEEDEMEQDPSMQTAGSMGSMGSGAAGGKYPPGTAPTMPESKINKGKVMENVDKDVAAMLESLKKYDILKESVAPVLGMKTLGEKKEKVEEYYYYKDPKNNKGDAFDKAEDDAAKKKKKEQDLDWKKHKKGKLKEDETEDDKEDDKEKVDEGADTEVLDWLKRFSKLGNMKGYGR